MAERVNSPLVYILSMKISSSSHYEENQTNSAQKSKYDKTQPSDALKVLPSEVHPPQTLHTCCLTLAQPTENCPREFIDLWFENNCPFCPRKYTYKKNKKTGNPNPWIRFVHKIKSSTTLAITILESIKSSPFQLSTFVSRELN